jgi:hypothetical protein
MSASFKHPLTDNERAAIKALQGVTFTPASFDKRFARDALFPALETGMLGEKWSAPDFRKQQAAANEQAKIDAMKRKYSEAMS